MKILLATLFFALALAPLTLAQQTSHDTAHQNAMSKMDSFGGNWTGKGQSWQKIDDEPEHWTGQMASQKVLSDRFIQRDLAVNMNMDGRQFTWVARTMIGYSAEAEGWMTHTVDNAGGVVIGDCYWTPDKALVTSNTYKMDGQVITDIERLQMRGGKLHVELQRSINGGPSFTHVKGVFERGGKTMSAASASFAKTQMLPPAPQMKKLKGFEGTWQIEGNMTQPDGSVRPVTGTQEASYAMGGHVMVTELTGDPLEGMSAPYRGTYYQAFDREHKRMIGMWFDSFGDIVIDETEITPNGTAISYSAGRSGGKISSDRGVTKPAPNGSLKLTHWSGSGTDAPKKTFEGTAKPTAPKGTTTRTRQR